MIEFLDALVGFIWSKPVVYACLFSGVFFSFRLLFIQFRCFPHAIALLSGKYDNPNEKGQITHFQALMAALSGTIGLGNIAGVAIAIALGGPGAVLWMWVVGIFGMATKYVECTLGTHYRQENEDGTVTGGPMYYITKGLGPKFKPFALFYAAAISLAAFGAVSMFQTNQAASALHINYNVAPWITGSVMLILTAIVIIGGIKRIGLVASKVVPSMCVIYVLGAIVICLINFDQIPAALSVIFTDAFTGQAAAGGLVTGVIMAGVRRAVFSNEAGLGSAAIAHAAVKTDYPIREGIVASLGPFIDTVVVCTATALVIVMSGHFGTERHQPTSGVHLSFENSAITSTPLLSGEWTRTRRNIPEESEVLRTFKDGDYVLSYDHKGVHQPLLLSNIDIQSGLLRFSYYIAQGNVQLRFFSPDNQLLGQGSMDRQTGTIIFTANKGDDRPFATLSGHYHRNEWKSAVIHFSDSAQDYFVRHGITTVSVQLMPLGNVAQLYIDRVQSISSTNGIGLTIASFDKFIDGFGSIFITIAVFFFAFSTLITWSYYGQTGVRFLFGHRGIQPYRWIYVSLIMLGALQPLYVVVALSDAMIGLLVIPNTIAIFLLSGKVSKWSDEYFEKLKNNEFPVYKKQKSVRSVGVLAK
jgi:AGCS family alanine or glycine:cation symporter